MMLNSLTTTSSPVLATKVQLIVKFNDNQSQVQFVEEAKEQVLTLEQLMQQQENFCYGFRDEFNQSIAQLNEKVKELVKPINGLNEQERANLVTTLQDFMPGELTHSYVASYLEQRNNKFKLETDVLAKFIAISQEVFNRLSKQAFDCRVLYPQSTAATFTTRGIDLQGHNQNQDLVWVDELPAEFNPSCADLEKSLAQVGKQLDAKLLQLKHLNPQDKSQMPLTEQAESELIRYGMVTKKEETKDFHGNTTYGAAVVLKESVVVAAAGDPNIVYVHLDKNGKVKTINTLINTHGASTYPKDPCAVEDKAENERLRKFFEQNGWEYKKDAWYYKNEKVLERKYNKWNYVDPNVLVNPTFQQLQKDGLFYYIPQHSNDTQDEGWYLNNERSIYWDKKENFWRYSFYNMTRLLGCPYTGVVSSTIDTRTVSFATLSPTREENEFAFVIGATDGFVLRSGLTPKLTSQQELLKLQAFINIFYQQEGQLNYLREDPVHGIGRLTQFLIQSTIQNSACFDNNSMVILLAWHNWQLPKPLPKSTPYFVVLDGNGRDGGKVVYKCQRAFPKLLCENLLALQKQTTLKESEPEQKYPISLALSKVAIKPAAVEETKDIPQSDVLGNFSQPVGQLHQGIANPITLTNPAKGSHITNDAENEEMENIVYWVYRLIVRG